MKLYPTVGKIAVKIDEYETETSAGIIVNNARQYEFKDGFSTGTVSSIGPVPPDSKGRIIPLEYEVGDRIMFPFNMKYPTLQGYLILEQHIPVAVIGKDTVVGGLG